MKAHVVPSSLDGLHDCFLEEHLRGREGVHLEMSETVLVLGIKIERGGHLGALSIFTTSLTNFVHCCSTLM
jgi:hypothetical protein